MRPAKVRYTRSGGVHVAYQAFGDGPIDLVWTPGMWSNIELVWEIRPIVAAYERLASFARVITFDPRGCGLSDAGTGTDTLEERMDDLRAVLDACGSDRAALCGYSFGGPMTVLFAATYPERTTALVLIGALARLLPGRYFMGTRTWNAEEVLERLERDWGEPVFWEAMAPSLANNPQARELWARFLRLSMSPSAAVGQSRVVMETDITPVLASVRVPTLVLHRTGDINVDPEHSRELAREIPGARLVELPGRDAAWWLGDVDSIFDEIEEFVTGARRTSEPDRVLATVLFTDVVGSTEKAAEVGDRSWRELLDRHNAVIRRELDRHRGREVKTVGDGFVATFDGPARAVRCAAAALEGVRGLGIQLRAGLHTGEVERMGADVGGIAVHIAARVAAAAGANEVLVSSTVKDLVAGSGIDFEDQGLRRLKGLPDEWRLFAVTSAS